MVENIMQMTLPLFKEHIDSLSYTDFIALINQTNVPPGSFSTLTKWRVNSGLNATSNIFEVACTTGFSLLNLVGSACCKGTGVDISELSIERAKQNAIQKKLDKRADFFCEDATAFKSREQFSHIVIGASLGFFPAPAQMIKNIFLMVSDVAYILASPFFSIHEMPTTVIQESKQVLGITPTIHNYKEIMKLYKGFDIEYEERLYSVPESEEEMQHYCHSTIERACKILTISDNAMYDILYNRLYKIKKISNRLREYQNYSVLILKYNRDSYPNRYVELF
jgi:ubiquinone/menaquinone biosynthesis C-methylase UbiE